jgi:hypothetical protein
MLVHIHFAAAPLGGEMLTFSARIFLHTWSLERQYGVDNSYSFRNQEGMTHAGIAAHESPDLRIVALRCRPVEVFKDDVFYE